MGTLLGVQIQVVRDFDEQIGFIERVQPPIGKIIQDNEPFLSRAKEVSPDTVWVGRVWVADQQWQPAHQRAIEHRDRILRTGITRKVNYWTGQNEPYPYNGNHVPVAEFVTELAQLLHAEGLKYIGFNWSVGVPHIPDWGHPAMLEAVQACDAIGVHEYSAPNVNQAESFDPRVDDLESYITSGWHCLRYRRAYAKLREHLSADQIPPWFIGECGVDGGIWEPFPGKQQGGWKPNLNDNYELYIEQLGWYDRQLQMDTGGDRPRILGATPFLWGCNDDWTSFDLLRPREASEAFGQYIIDHKEKALPTGWIDMRDKLAAQTDQHGNKLNWPKRSKTDTIVIHHTAVDPSVGPERIASYHVHTKGWTRSAYTIEVGPEGKIYLINDLDAACAGVSHQNDHITQICLLGSFMDGYEPPSQQLLAARSVIVDLWDMYGKIPVQGHKNYLITDCPGDTWDGPLGWKVRLMPPDEDVTDWKARALLAEDRLFRIDQITEEG